jgi:hypothetical protein
MIDASILAARQPSYVSSLTREQHKGPHDTIRAQKRCATTSSCRVYRADALQPQPLLCRPLETAYRAALPFAQQHSVSDEQDGSQNVCFACKAG